MKVEKLLFLLVLLEKLLEALGVPGLIPVPAAFKPDPGVSNPDMDQGKVLAKFLLQGCNVGGAPDTRNGNRVLVLLFDLFHQPLGKVGLAIPVHVSLRDLVEIVPGWAHVFFRGKIADDVSN